MKKKETKGSKVKELRKWSFVAFGAFLSGSQLCADLPAEQLVKIREKMFPEYSDQQPVNATDRQKSGVVQLAQAEYYDYSAGYNMPYISDYYAYEAYAVYYNYANYSDSYTNYSDS